MIPRDALRSLFADLSGMVTIWDGDPEPFPADPAAPGLTCRLSVESLGPIGTDEYRRTATDGVAQAGVRRLIVGVRVTGISEDAPATDFLEYVRTRLARRTTLSRLRANGLAFASTDAAVELNTIVDRESVFDARMSVHFALAFTDDYANPSTPAAYDRRSPPNPQPLPAEDANYVSTVNTDDKVPGP